MSLKFVFGPSGSGKSRQIYSEITERARENPRQNFLIVVPDQFTMQTQKELVLLNDRGGILNIDVLSFGRLNHRIMEEVGREEVPVLDDTGKSLVLQKVAANLKDELPVLGSFLHRQGYIHEVKSAISEFMQYGIGTEDVSKLIAYAGKRGALAGKLKDLETLYKGFTEYIKDNFITTEETLDVLRRSLHKSKLLPGSVVVFDGFTGFTPIQNRLIQELMQVCGEVVLTVTLGEGENPYVKDGEQKLFYLSKKTVADLDRLAKEAGVPREKDVFINTYYRFEKAPALRHLERNLFRYPFQVYEGGQSEICLFETTTPRDEVHQTGLKIRELVREQGLAFRDIAVVMGDLEGYAPYVETEFAQMEIPCFIDRTRGIALNPMIESIKSALELFEKDFSYEAVFHYLRSGMADLERGEIDELENYVIRTGVRGYRSYSRLFTRKAEKSEKEEEALGRINHLREQMMEQLAPLVRKKEGRVKDYIDGLYDFLVQNEVQNKLAAYERRFEEQGQLPRAREYAQIYRLVMELLDQIYELLGEEIIPLAEFREILEAGFGEIQVGTIPQNVDRVVVGDMERTRLKQVKALFFLGVNDGNIPKNASKGGIISDMDREFLRESELELAPSPRQQMYIQALSVSEHDQAFEMALSVLFQGEQFREVPAPSLSDRYGEKTVSGNDGGVSPAPSSPGADCHSGGGSGIPGGRAAGVCFGDAVLGKDTGILHLISCLRGGNAGGEKEFPDRCRIPAVSGVWPVGGGGKGTLWKVSGEQRHPPGNLCRLRVPPLFAVWPCLKGTAGVFF